MRKVNYNEPAYLKAKSEMQATMGTFISIPFLFAEKIIKLDIFNFSFQTEKEKMKNERRYLQLQQFQ